MPSKYICASVVKEFLNIDAKFQINRPKLYLVRIWGQPGNFYIVVLLVEGAGRDAGAERVKYSPRSLLLNVNSSLVYPMLVIVLSTSYQYYLPIAQKNVWDTSQRSLTATSPGYENVFLHISIRKPTP